MNINTAPFVGNKEKYRKSIRSKNERAIVRLLFKGDPVTAFCYFNNIRRCVDRSTIHFLSHRLVMNSTFVRSISRVSATGIRSLHGGAPKKAVPAPRGTYRTNATGFFLPSGTVWPTNREQRRILRNHYSISPWRTVKESQKRTSRII